MLEKHPLWVRDTGSGSLAQAVGATRAGIRGDAGSERLVRTEPGHLEGQGGGGGGGGGGRGGGGGGGRGRGGGRGGGGGGGAGNKREDLIPRAQRRLEPQLMFISSSTRKYCFRPASKRPCAPRSQRRPHLPDSFLREPQSSTR